jgi:hypothetical protein
LAAKILPRLPTAASAAHRAGARSRRRVKILGQPWNPPFIGHSSNLVFLVKPWYFHPLYLVKYHDFIPAVNSMFHGFLGNFQIVVGQTPPQVP